jgi:UDP-glucose 4-epimerase
MISFKANTPVPASQPEGRASRTLQDRILITGLENSLANFLAHGFFEQGRDVTVQAVSGETIITAMRNFPVIEYSLAEERFVEALARLQPEVIIHAAAEPSSEPSSHWPQAAHSRIVDKTLTLCEAARRHSPQSRIVLLSSAEVYGECMTPAKETAVPNPVSIQGRYMRMAEQVLNDFAEIHGLNTTVLRIASAYGPAVVNNPVYDLLFSLSGPQGTNSARGVKPSAMRDLIHAADVTQAVGVILDKTRNGVFNIGTGQSISLLELCSHLCSLLEIAPSALPTTAIPQASREQLDISKLTELGFSPRVELLEGLRGFAAWWSGSRAA